MSMKRRSCDTENYPFSFIVLHTTALCAFTPYMAVECSAFNLLHLEMITVARLSFKFIRADKILIFRHHIVGGDCVMLCKISLWYCIYCSQTT